MTNRNDAPSAAWIAQWKAIQNAPAPEQFATQSEHERTEIRSKQSQAAASYSLERVEKLQNYLRLNKRPRAGHMEYMNESEQQHLMLEIQVLETSRTLLSQRVSIIGEGLDLEQFEAILPSEFDEIVREVTPTIMGEAPDVETEKVISPPVPMASDYDPDLPESKVEIPSD